jgi:hypothetical protein
MNVKRCARCGHLVMGKDGPECGAPFRCVHAYGTPREQGLAWRPDGYRTPEDKVRRETRDA